MLRTRVSHLEAFRRLHTEWAEPSDELRLINAIFGQADHPSRIMRAGSDWHALLAGIKPSGEFTFDPAVVEQARQEVGTGLCELPGRRIFDLGKYSIEVKGTADWRAGPLIQDHKTVFSTPDTTWYEQSLQWRFYLAIHDCTAFQYNLWHFAEPDDAGACQYKDVLRCRFYHYPELERDCREWLSRFLGWAEERSLFRALETIIP